MTNFKRFITLWRKAPPSNTLDWEFHISESRSDADQVVANLTKDGKIRQYSTYILGDRLPDLSSNP